MMLRPQGYACIAEPNTTGIELDTFSCGHCNRVRHVKPKQDPTEVGGLCKTCMRLICPACVNRGHCDPLEEKIERLERTLDFDRWFLEASR